MATTEVARKPRRRWRQFGLRTLGLLILLVAVGMALWRTLLAEHFLVKWVERQKGTATTEPALPDWLAWLPGSDQCVHITEVNLGGCRVGDDDLWRFEKLPKLRELHLMNSDVTLPAVEAMVDAKPDLVCNLAFAEHLYWVVWQEYRIGGTSVGELLRTFDLAEHYKLAVADFKGQPDESRRAAVCQHLRWLQQLADRIAQSNPKTNMQRALEELWVRSAQITDQLRWASLAEEPTQLDMNSDQIRDLGRALVDAAFPVQEAGLISVYDMADVLKSATTMQLLDNSGDEHRERRVEILVEHDRNLRRLANYVGQRYFAQQPDGENDKWVVMLVLILQNRARLATARNDRDGETQALQKISKWADRLRRGILAAHETGTVTKGTTVACLDLAREAEIDWALAKQDRVLETAIRAGYRRELDNQSKRGCGFAFVGLFGSEFDARELLAFWLCVGMTAHMEDEGLPFFEHGFRAYLKKQLP